MVTTEQLKWTQNVTFIFHMVVKLFHFLEDLTGSELLRYKHDKEVV